MGKIKNFIILACVISKCKFSRVQNTNLTLFCTSDARDVSGGGGTYTYV